MKRFTLQQSITNKKDSISLQLYLHEISKYRRITIDEEVELAQRIKKAIFPNRKSHGCNKPKLKIATHAAKKAKV